ncbi:MAG: hypothetical protein IPH57_12255 [Saprospiraceae bacterium]|nr:hypothetical protein [Saprospiraceae bacterium]
MIFYDIIIHVIPFMTFMISVFFNRNKTPVDTVFSIMTGYIFLTEVLGSIVGRYLHFDNFFLYNFYCLFFPLINFRIFSMLSKSAPRKKLIKTLSFVLILIFIGENIIFKNLFTEIQYHTYLISLIFLIYIISVHLLEIMESDIIHDFYRSKSFWISTGLLLFSVPFLPMMIAFKFMTLNFEIRMVVTSILIIAMHSCFIVASLRTKYK